MQETIKKFTDDLLKEFQAQMQKKEFKDFVEKTTKETSDSGSFEVVISTADLDRQGESIDQNGWDLTNYKTNPVVLWGHDYWSLPIGVADEIDVRDGKLVAKGRFAPAEANPFAQQVRRLYDLKIVRATSVGFIVKEAQDKVITKAELLEFSFVPVPANPFSLSLMQVQKFGIDVAMLATKGLKFEVKQDEEPKEGDACTMEDGTEGEYHADENGEMVCKPKQETKPEPETEGEFIIIRVKDPDYFDPDSFRTISISEDEGIKATVGCKKGEYSGGKCSIGNEVQRYLFDKEKWTESEAQAWVDEHKSFTEKKGAIGEQVNADEVRKQKWEKLNRIWNIFDAFIGVYLDEKTAVEDFDTLLDEAISLMKGESQESAIAKAVTNPKRVRMLIARKDVEKIGAELSSMQSEVDNSIVTHAKAIIEIIQSEYAEKPEEEKSGEIKQAIETIKKGIAAFEKIKGSEGEEQSPDGTAPNQRPSDAGADLVIKNFNEFMMTRRLLRRIVTEASNSLERMNQKIRKERMLER